jgi:hypothetical protein
MVNQKNTRRQKDISRLLREKKYNQPQRSKKDNIFPSDKRDVIWKKHLVFPQGIETSYKKY